MARRCACEDVGKVFDSVQNDRVANWWNNTASVVLAVERQPGTNTVEVVDAVRQLLPQFRGDHSAVGARCRFCTTAQCRSASPWAT